MVLTAITARKFFDISTAAEYHTSLVRVAAARGVALPAWTEDRPKGGMIQARIEAWRWLMECPDCHDCLFAEPQWGFLCPNCANVANDGRYRPVVWPVDPAAIEAVLSVRPVENRNWTPGESLDDLRRENQEHGL